MSVKPGTPSDGTPRRGFLQAVGAIFAGALAGFAPVAAGAATLFDPLRRRGGEAGAMVKVTNLSGLTEGSAPKRVTVLADRVDAWTKYETTPVGAVYLKRDGDRVEAFNVVCPHAGCSVNLASDRSHFTCPCHRSRFALDGTREEGPAPRGLDRLDAEVRDGEVWVRFQNFRPGIEEKVPM